MSSLLQGLFDFLDASPTPYHAVTNVVSALRAEGFTQLKEEDSWQLKPGGRYYITRRDASILAFKYGLKDVSESGVHIVGAHTDSPTLKLKPEPDLFNKTYTQMGIEVYGGVLLAPWFDRDLSLAGRVSVRSEVGVEQVLINFKRPIATIPSLAIHLDRTANSNRSINPQEQMRPLLLQGEVKRSIAEILAQEISQQGRSCLASDILGHDLSFYDVQGAATWGIENQFFASARLDNLLSSYVGLRALLESDDTYSSVLALYDHEEVGSQSDIGANSNMLMAFIERLCSDSEHRHRTLAKSTLLSVDNAHGVHPNFANKHDEGHGPILNRGPVIKVDACQSYATSNVTSSMVKVLAQQANVAVQSYVTRADMRCGSTIGPMSAAKTGIQTADIGVPTFAMHSIREQAGTEDVMSLLKLIKVYLNSRLSFT